MPDWLTAIGLTIGVLAGIAAVCFAGTGISYLFQRWMDRRVWK